MTDTSCHVPSQLWDPGQGLNTEEELEEALAPTTFLFLREGACLQGSARLGPVTLGDRTLEASWQPL